MKKYLIAAAASISLMGCSGSSGIKHSDGEVEIAAVRLEARRAARKFIYQQWSDSAELRQNYREIFILRDSLTRSHHKEVFDSTFISTLRTVEPDLASAVDRGRLNP